ncbi:MAG: NAD(P)/FAD-dependent oxidoreductase, partial [Anaerolineae bacterium]
GNGRCNLSNANLDPAVYATDAPSALAEVLDRYGYPQLLADLDALGIPTYATWDGWTYPVSNSGASVAEILAYALELAGVHVHLLTKVTAIERRSDGFARDRFALELGNSPQHDVHDRLIVAAGGEACGALGSRGECFPMLEALGHTVLPVRPALVPLTTDLRPPRDVLQKLHGVRLDVGLKLYAGKRLLGQTLGNLMFTRDGLSGPAPMDLAYLMSSHPDEPLEARIDLVPSHGAVFEELLARGRERDAPAAVVLEAFMPPKAPPVLLQL